MADWHLNEGLAPLVAQVRMAHPGIVIGTIGDAAHRAEKSDHNPNAAGRVNAADFMLGNAFSEAQANALLPFLIRDHRTHYVIHDRKIWTTETGAWRAYTGSDPHTNHIHLSVKDSAHTDPKPWVITEEDDMPTAQEIAQALLAAKIGDEAYPNRTVGDVLRDASKLRGVLVGDAKDTANAKLPASSPLAKLLDLPAGS